MMEVLKWIATSIAYSQTAHAIFKTTMEKKKEENITIANPATTEPDIITPTSRRALRSER